MIFNGQTPESIAALDETTMLQIQMMYADGMLGNGSILKLIGALTNGIFNYIRSNNTQPYKLETILGSVHDYLYRPLTKDEQTFMTNNKLLAFMMQSPGCNKELFEDKNG